MPQWTDLAEEVIVLIIFQFADNSAEQCPEICPVIVRQIGAVLEPVAGHVGIDSVSVRIQYVS